MDVIFNGHNIGTLERVEMVPKKIYEPAGLLSSTRPGAVADSSSELRRLRLWHWHKVKIHRDRSNMFKKLAEQWEAEHGVKYGTARSHRSKMRQEEGISVFHLKFVEALNDVPCLKETTADQDEERRRGLSKK